MRKRNVKVRRNAYPVPSREQLFSAMYGGTSPRQTPQQDDVFATIRRERMLQDHLFGTQDERSIGDYILIAEEYLNRAKHYYVDNPLQEAIDAKVSYRPVPRRQSPKVLLRKVAAIIVKCLEQHGD